MKLFEPCKIGSLTFQNRVVMAPMTRSRATGNCANELMATYYGQRAAAGLLITEGTSPSPNGLGYARIPGIFSAEQAKGWRLVSKASHASGARLFIQLMHCGRVGSRFNLPPGAELLAPSACALSGMTWTDLKGEQPYDLPREMTPEDIRSTLEEYCQASRNAIAAGCDGVEVHGANGYLITQFLDPGSNHRTDAYGGNSAGRNRFAVEATRAAADAIGPERVGVRISPYGLFNEMSGTYDGIVEQYLELAGDLGRMGLLYLHLVDHSAMGAPKPDPAAVQAICQTFRQQGGQAVILSGGYDAARAETDLQNGSADLIAFGRPFISNPDLVIRLREGIPLAEPDQTTFYTPGPAGYTDYPAAS